MSCPYDAPIRKVFFRLNEITEGEPTHIPPLRRKLPKKEQINAILKDVTFPETLPNKLYDDLKKDGSVLDADYLILRDHFIRHQPQGDISFRVEDLLVLPKELNHYEAGTDGIKIIRKNGEVKLALRRTSNYLFQHINNWLQLGMALQCIPKDYQQSVSHLDEALVDLIRAGGYLDKRSEKQIVEEVEIRRKQYPSDDIYGFVDDRMKTYLEDLHKGNFLNVKWLQLDGYRGHYWRQNNRKYKHSGKNCAPWESAIIAQSQIETTMADEYSYTLEKHPRYWKVRQRIKIEALAKMKCRQEDKKELERPVIGDPRLAALELE